jgi:hypothetical protein
VCIGSCSLVAVAEPEAKLRGGQFAKSSCMINDALSKQGDIATSPCFSSLSRPTCYSVCLVCIFFSPFQALLSSSQQQQGIIMVNYSILYTNLSGKGGGMAHYGPNEAPPLVGSTSSTMTGFDLWDSTKSCIVCVGLMYCNTPGVCLAYVHHMSMT